MDCTVEQMREAAEGHLTTEALMWNQNKNERTISGMTSDDFRKRLDAKLIEEGYDIMNQRYPEGYQEAPLAYDAVWSVALAFNKTMDRLHKFGKRLEDFNYNNKEIADDIYSAINSTQFLGISVRISLFLFLFFFKFYSLNIFIIIKHFFIHSYYFFPLFILSIFFIHCEIHVEITRTILQGFVAFSSQGDRIALTQIEQVVNGSYIVLGYYDTQADNLTWLNREVWSGGKVPQDRTIIRRVLRTVSLPLFICMCVISSVGIIIAVGLIVFNIWNSHRRYHIFFQTKSFSSLIYKVFSVCFKVSNFLLFLFQSLRSALLDSRVIQSSHPVCNTIMLFGVIVCLASVFLLGLDGRFVSPSAYPSVCQARAWLLTTGFTLSYGAMFSKVWRVHRLTTKAKSDPKVRMVGLVVLLLRLLLPKVRFIVQVPFCRFFALTVAVVILD